MESYLPPPYSAGGDFWENRPWIHLRIALRNIFGILLATSLSRRRWKFWKVDFQNVFICLKIQKFIFLLSRFRKGLKSVTFSLCKSSEQPKQVLTAYIAEIMYKGTHNKFIGQKTVYRNLFSPQSNGYINFSSKMAQILVHKKNDHNLKAWKIC